MSFDLTAAVFKVRGLTALEFRLLSALANHANAQTGLCCPSRALLAREAECSERQVTRAVRTLKKRGLVRQVSRGAKATPVYEFPGLVSPEHQQVRGDMGAAQNQEVKPPLSKTKDSSIMGKTGKKAGPSGEKTYKAHPLANLLPRMGEAEFEELVEDVRKYGLRQPIVLFEDQILDGRHRYDACLEAGRAPFFEEFSGDALAFVLSLNLTRRHLTAAQRAMIAAQLAKMQPGRPSAEKSAPPAESPKADKNPASVPDSGADKTEPLTQAEAAEKLGVGERTVRDARTVLEGGDKETVDAVMAGEKSLSAAVREVRAKQEKPQDVLDRFGHVIPADILPDWRRAEEWVTKATQAISRIKCDLEDGLENKDRIFRRVTQSTVSELKAIFSELNTVRPHTVCPTCSGRNHSHCSMCKGQGWLSKFTYGAVRKEVRTMWEAKGERADD